MLDDLRNRSLSLETADGSPSARDSAADGGGAEMAKTAAQNLSRILRSPKQCLVAQRHPRLRVILLVLRLGLWACRGLKTKLAVKGHCRVQSAARKGSANLRRQPGSLLQDPLHELPGIAFASRPLRHRQPLNVKFRSRSWQHLVANVTSNAPGPVCRTFDQQRNKPTLLACLCHDILLETILRDRAGLLQQGLPIVLRCLLASPLLAGFARRRRLGARNLPEDVLDHLKIAAQDILLLEHASYSNPPLRARPAHCKCLLLAAYHNSTTEASQCFAPQ
mmetsp:Transcript_101324/g.254052  ORF Transcript_101324/g.254052 Transcript_101324/m.254052 type:complete len:278 (+) Transcript_101324:317-1150(+)